MVLHHTLLRLRLLIVGGDVGGDVGRVLVGVLVAVHQFKVN